MNVYSLRLIPSLKLKVCELLGIASTLAISELKNRVDRLEVVLDRVDQRARRAPRPKIFFQETPPKTVKAKKKAAVKKTTVPAKAQTLSSVAAPSEVAVEASLPVEKIEVSPVLLIQADEDTKRSVLEYFGSAAPCIQAETVAEALEKISGKTPQAVFFDRLLLGQDDSRAALQKLAEDFPAAKMVGLSSYLTLAFSQSMPAGASDFATFLTKPLQTQGLRELFQESGEPAEVRA